MNRRQRRYRGAAKRKASEYRRMVGLVTPPDKRREFVPRQLVHSLMKQSRMDILDCFPGAKETHQAALAEAMALLADEQTPPDD